MTFASGQFGTPRMPEMGAKITMPDVYVDTSRGRIMHKQVARAAVKDTLHWHHQHVMRSHFQSGNRAKYQHKRRWVPYLIEKRRRWKSSVDLVKSRRSQNTFLNKEPKVSFHSGMPTGIIHGYQRYKWPFKQARGKPNSRRAVTKRQMNAEVTRWTPDEVSRGAKVFAESWVKHYRQKLVGRKKLTKIIGPKL